MIYAKKSLGQHFLICSWVAPLLIKTAHIHTSDTILEVGPGKGALTYALAETGANIMAIEKDERLAETLIQELATKQIRNVAIQTGDVLRSFPEIKGPYKVVANIPYYLTSRLVRKLLYETPNAPECIVMTVQKEVAERIIATPPHTNLLGLAVSFRAHARIIKTIPPECFRPRPSVDSAIILIEPNKQLVTLTTREAEEILAIAKKAFQGKRKTIGNTLALKKTLLPLSLIQKRPEALSITEWIKIYNTIEA